MRERSPRSKLPCRALILAALLASAPASAQPCYTPALGPPPCFAGAAGPCCFTFTPPTPSLDVCTPPLSLLFPFGCTGSSDCPAASDCFGVSGPCLAAVGVAWPPGQEGLGAQTGVHLRWAFNLVSADDGFPPGGNGLVFPRGGFEIQRRNTGTTGDSWLTICPRLYPATDLATAVSRIPPGLPPEELSSYSLDLNCNGAPDLADLVDLVERAFCREQAYRTLFWVEGTPDPKNEGVDEVYGDDDNEPIDGHRIDEEAIVDEFHWYLTRVDDVRREKNRPPLTFELQPMRFLMTAAVDPILARVLGLYYVDLTALPGNRYEYRILAHHDDLGFRLCARVEVSTLAADIAPPPPPAFFTASVPPGSDRPLVDLSWENQIEEAIGGPENRLELEDGILPLRHIILRDDLGDAVPLARLKRTIDVCGIETALPVPPVVISTMPAPVIALAAGLGLGAVLEALEIEPPDDWRDPPYYRDSLVEADHVYAYTLRGMDLFGRYSAPVAALPVAVPRRAVIPAPILTDARIFQKGEGGFGGDLVLRARWLWPLSFRELYPGEPREFRVFAGEPGIDAGAMERLATVPADPKASLVELPVAARPCDDGRDNDLDRLADYPDDPDCESEEDTTEGPPACSDARDNDLDGAADFPADAGCESAEDTTEEPTAAELYETVITLKSKRFVEPVSEINPKETIAYFEVGVRAYNSDGIASALLRRQRVAIRDFTAPTPPPAPARPLEPGLDGAPRPPGPPDPEGRSAIALEWDAKANLTYFLHRTDDRTICRSMRENGIEVDSCAALPDDDLGDYAANHPEIFTPVTPGPVGPFLVMEGADPDAVAGTLRLADRVPGLASGRYIYILGARDPAGNVSNASSPGEPIFVPDGLAPSKPVIARARSVDPRVMARTIRIDWLPNAEDGPDGDLLFYRLYRTDREEWPRSKRRMTLLLPVLEAGSREDGAAYYSVLDTVPRPERTQYYRLEAVDASGNVSVLSETAAARTVDRLAPAAPVWVIGPRWACEGERLVDARWRTSGDDTESRLERRRVSGAWQALTGWREGETLEHEDLTVDPELSHEYRVVARDAAGNTSSSEIWFLDPAPECEEPRPYVRGDIDLDEDVSIGDVFSILCVLFGDLDFCPRAAGAGAGGGAPVFRCAAAADVNGDGAIDISDLIYLVRFLFLDGPQPPQPFPGCDAGAREPLPCDASTCDRRLR